MRSDLPSKKLATAPECLHDVRTTCPSPALVEVWCDGSVSSEGEGGSGFIIVKRMDGHSEEVTSGSFASGIIATSFTAESRAALEGLTRAQQVLAETTPPVDLLIVSDSRSLVDAITADPYRMASDIVPVYEALCTVAEQAHTIHLVWVSSHCGLVMNDKADSTAAIGTSLPQTSPIPVQAVKTAVRHSTQYPPPLLNIKKLG